MRAHFQKPRRDRPVESGQDARFAFAHRRGRRARIARPFDLENGDSMAVSNLMNLDVVYNLDRRDDFPPADEITAAEVGRRTFACALRNQKATGQESLEQRARLA